jgi:hypothetical protein
MIAEAGYPLEDGLPPAGSKPDPPINPLAALEWMVEGYESVAGPGTVDQGRLQRMLALRREFYRRFAATALSQGVADLNTRVFLHYLQRWLNT